MTIDALKTKAAALREELAEIETAIKVLERYEHSGVETMEVEDAPAPTETERFDLSALSAKSAVAFLLGRAPKRTMTKQELREALVENGATVPESTLTWTLTFHKDTFKSHGGGVWSLA